MHAELVDDGAYNIGRVLHAFPIYCSSIGSKVQWTAQASADGHLAGLKRFLTLGLFLVSDLVSQESDDPDAQSSFLPADQ